MLKQILEEFKIQKRVSPEEFNIIKKVLLKYFKDGREWAKKQGKTYMPFTYIKDFGNGRRIEVSRFYTSGAADWYIGCSCEDCKTDELGVRINPNYIITDLFESEDLEKLEKFFKKVIKEFPKENIDCKQDKWDKFIERIIQSL